MKKFIKKILIRLKNIVNSRPKLKRFIIYVLNNFPSFKNRLQKIGKVESAQFRVNSSFSSNVMDYPEPTQKIYYDIKKSIETQKRINK